MDTIQCCPKCDTRFDPPRELRSECPKCGIWFHKWNAPPPIATVVTVDPIELAADIPSTGDSLAFWGRAIALAVMCTWGVFIAAADFRVPPQRFDPMHAIVLPIHEAGHVFFMFFGEFLHVAGGSIFQVGFFFGIGVFLLLKRRDPFAAAVFLWFSGASLVDLSVYIYDAWEPKLILLGGHTGEYGQHDWVDILDHFNALRRAQPLGVAVHHFGVLTMIAAAAWGATVLRKTAGRRRRTE